MSSKGSRVDKVVQISNLEFVVIFRSYYSAIMFELIGSHCAESTNRMNQMWQKLRSTNQEEFRSKSILDANSLARSSIDMVKLGQKSETSFHGILRKCFYSDIDEDDMSRLRLIIETRAKIKEVHRSSETRRYLKYNETQSADKLKDIWLEFLHQISVPAEILDLSEQEFEKVKAV